MKSKLLPGNTSVFTLNVVGGSASAAHALPDESLAWPRFLEKKLLAENVNLRMDHRCQGGLTLVRSIELIGDLFTSDILILHFGTSVAWPSPLVRLGHRFGFETHNEFAFHQPPYAYGGSWVEKRSRWFRLRARNFLKYLLFMGGAYRPRNSIREVKDQVSAVISLARKKSDRIIWIQHRSLQSKRILLERAIYSRYYRRVISAVKEIGGDNLVLMELPQEYLNGENYLIDGVHLSELGHSNLASMIRKML